MPICVASPYSIILIGQPAWGDLRHRFTCILSCSSIHIRYASTSLSMAGTISLRMVFRIVAEPACSIRLFDNGKSLMRRGGTYILASNRAWSTNTISLPSSSAASAHIPAKVENDQIKTTLHKGRG